MGDRFLILIISERGLVGFIEAKDDGGGEW